MDSIIIKTNGSFTVCNPEAPKNGWKLEELYRNLGCDMVEVVHLVNRLPASLKGFRKPILICDEEALFSNKAVNQIASMIAGTRIVGDVILTESKNLK
jgi:hypothetical protein